MEKCLETGEDFSSQLPVISAPTKPSLGPAPFLLSQGQVNRLPRMPRGRIKDLSPVPGDYRREGENET